LENEQLTKITFRTKQFLRIKAPNNKAKDPQRVKNTP